MDSQLKAQEIAQVLTYGVEVEWTSSQLSRSQVAHFVAAELALSGHSVRPPLPYETRFSALLSDGSYGDFNFVHDGSVPYGGEMVTPILRLSDMELLQSVVRAMRKAGCKTDPHRAGIHVHVGAGALTVNQIRNVTKFVSRWEQHIFAASNPNPSRLNWCQPIKESFKGVVAHGKDWGMTELNEAWYSHNGGHQGKHQKYHPSRYHGLNLHSLFRIGTMEFRYFNGTLHAGKIRAYVNMCLGIVARGATARCIHTKPAPYSGPVDLPDFLKALRITEPTTRKHLLDNALERYGVSRAAEQHEDIQL